MASFSRDKSRRALNNEGNNKRKNNAKIAHSN